MKDALPLVLRVILGGCSDLVNYTLAAWMFDWLIIIINAAGTGSWAHGRPLWNTDQFSFHCLPKQSHGIQLSSVRDPTLVVLPQGLSCMIQLCDKTVIKV